MNNVKTFITTKFTNFLTLGIIAVIIHIFSQFTGVFNKKK
jgi:hypothetical protein